MKHIFTIHSSLTFLVAYVIIEYLQLKKDSIILISSNYIPPIDRYRVVPSFSEINTGFLKKIRTLNVPKNHDRYIDKITNEDTFTAYIDLMSYYQKILVTHKNCKRFHFFEEGNSAYQVVDDLMDITWADRNLSFRDKFFSLKSLIRVLRGYNLRLLSMPYIYSAYANMEDINFFSLSKNAFLNASSSKKIILKPNSEDPNIAIMAGNYHLENEVVWLDGSNGRYTGLSEDYYYAAIQKAIDILKKRRVIDKHVFVKLRPGIKNYEEIKLVSILMRNNIEVKVIPNNMILECFFMLSKSCHVVGTLTAALEYAHVFGHKTYSIYGLFDKQVPTIFDRMTGFWENLENLKEI